MPRDWGLSHPVLSFLKEVDGAFSVFQRGRAITLVHAFFVREESSKRVSLIHTYSELETELKGTRTPLLF